MKIHPISDEVQVNQKLMNIKEVSHSYQLLKDLQKDEMNKNLCIQKVSSDAITVRLARFQTILTAASY
jgi:hypothetical protein